MFAAELWGFLRDSTPEQRRRRYGDVEYDWDHRVDTTSATVGWRDRLLGVFHSPYQPTEPALFHEMLAALNIALRGFHVHRSGVRQGSHADDGVGLSFSRIVGVELLPELNRVAQENLAQIQVRNAEVFSTRIASAPTRANSHSLPIRSCFICSNPLPQAGLAQVIEQSGALARGTSTQGSSALSQPYLRGRAVAHGAG